MATQYVEEKLGWSGGAIKGRHAEWQRNRSQGVMGIVALAK
jgi:hypothetical protein